jgi:hypothetical protein
MLQPVCVPWNGMRVGRKLFDPASSNEKLNNFHNAQYNPTSMFRPTLPLSVHTTIIHFLIPSTACESVDALLIFLGRLLSAQPLLSDKLDSKAVDYRKRG